MKLRGNGIPELLALLLLFILMVTGCGSPPSSEPHPPAPPPPYVPEASSPSKGTVSYHVWGALISYGMEQSVYPGYAVYTYVLFNRNQPEAGSPEEERYDSILKAILQDVKPREIGESAGWPKYETNIFCIPFLTREPKKTDALKKYDFVLSQRYLAELQQAVRNNRELFQRLERRSGPFLFSVYEPLPRLRGKTATKMLYLDLTDMPPDGMRQILDSYRQRLDSAPLKNVERLRESLRMGLMKFALALDENLKIVDVTFARLQ
jgi:hypothetical protein